MSPLLTRGVHLEELPAGAALFRVHRTDRAPLWFGPASGSGQCRFDAPNGEFRTCYAGLSLTAAFTESVLHRPTGQVVKRDALFTRAWSEIKTARKLKLAQFRGPGILKHGLSLGEIAAPSYKVTQPLALEVYQACAEADGIIFRSSHDDDEFNVALFDRVAPEELPIISTTPFSAWPQSEWLPLLTKCNAMLEPDLTSVPADTDVVLLAERDRIDSPSTYAKPPRLK